MEAVSNHTIYYISKRGRHNPWSFHPCLVGAEDIKERLSECWAASVDATILIEWPNITVRAAVPAILRARLCICTIKTDCHEY
uniref:TA20 protein n=1 Tax=Solanum tuberosum TaxID=4113 RepID=M1B3J1_SOLTU